MKLTTLTPLLEVEADYDPWNDSDDTPYPRYKALTYTTKAVQHRLDSNNAKLMDLLPQANKSKSVVSTLPANTKDSEYKLVYFDNRTYYVKSDPTDRLAQRVLKLFSWVMKDETFLRDMPNLKAKQVKHAAADYLKRGKVKPSSVVDPQEIYENIRVYHREEEKFKWLHNPVKFGEDPKYAGSPDHYDWQGAFATVYFELADWLDENGTPFQKVFAALDEGKPWIVAVAANHAFVLQIHAATGTIYIRGQEPISAKKFLKQPFGVLTAVKNTLQTALHELDKHGALVKSGD